MDNLTKEQRRKNMQNIRSKNTKPELILRKALWEGGIRYRIHAKDIIGRPDIYIKKKKLAVFVDSDFWHGRLYQEGKAIPKTNKDYWIPKLERNIARDKEVTAVLKSKGWHVLRFWEKDIKKDVKACVKEIVEVLK